MSKRRQKALGDIDPTVARLVGMNHRTERKRPLYPSEARRTKATYDLPRELQDAIREIARELNVPISHVVRAFLEDASKHYREGSLQLTPKPDPSKLRLF